MGKLDGKVALITGGSEGIGFATAQRFIAEGAEHVFITGRRQAALDEAVKKIGAPNVTAVQGDTSNMADLDKLFEVIRKEKGRLNIVFANAATCTFARFGAVSEKHFDDTFNVNVKGVLFTVQKALPLLVDGSSIILNGSNSSNKGDPDLSVYCATKAAIRAFARCWTVDLKERKIRVNAMSPGAIDTPLLRSMGGTEEEVNANLAIWQAATPMNRIGQPDEVAKAVVFLASDDSSYITGIELFVDGGLSQI
jgi:NAD(P)-dependent dehydrogenase (short-subunit alcohol dehydrogenase family)